MNLTFSLIILFTAISLFSGGDGCTPERPSIPPARPVRLVSLEAPESIVSGFWSRELDAYAMPLDSIPERTFLRFRDGFRMPCNAGIRSHFGRRRGRYHNGVDLPVPTGTKVCAAFGGKVRISAYFNGYGHVVVIRHPNGLETCYAHLSKRLVSRGDAVAAGDVIALSGCSGRSTGPHLHFETVFCGRHFDPESIIDFGSGALRSDGFILRREMLKQ